LSLFKKQRTKLATKCFCLWITCHRLNSSSWSTTDTNCCQVCWWLKAAADPLVSAHEGVGW